MKKLDEHKYKSALSDAKRAEKQLLRQLEASERRAGVSEALRASAKPVKPVKTSRSANLHKRVATPVFLLSDWHVEECVDPKTVGGVNAYNPDIADARIERLGNAMRWMIEHHRKSFEIREVVCWLGGDLLSGYIHDELKEVNATSPVETLLWLQDRITNLLGKLMDIPGIEHIRVPCSYGNHGRTTHKSQVATGAANSFEWLMYHQLRRSWRSSKVQFDIADGAFLRMQVHKTRCGFTHGDVVRYGGGVGGVMIPINKAMAKWDTYGQCDMWHVAHFHQLHYLPRVTVNSSLIGTSPYGMSVGAFESPAQASYLIDSKRGPCMTTTLWPDASNE